MTDLPQRLAKAGKLLKQLSSQLDLDQKQSRIIKLQKLSLASDFWQDEEAAKNTMIELANLETLTGQLKNLDTKLKNLSDLANLSQPDDATLERDIAKELKKVERELSTLKLTTYLNHPYDSKHALLSVHSGQGGTEAMDWAQMLLRMYTKYFDQKKWTYQLVNQNYGEEAGIKTATVMIKAAYAYGYLKNESGTHRLVRQSPFNADNLRQTSFALVEVLPVIDQSARISPSPSELEWHFTRAGGSGGQNVNKLNTAVRLTHLPTGTTIYSQGERTQEGNRKLALKLLESKLWQIERQKEDQQTKRLKGPHQTASFGSQIRSYVLHPYQLVKDYKSEHQTTNAQAVLDGDLEAFIQQGIYYPT